MNQGSTKTPEYRRRSEDHAVRLWLFLGMFGAHQFFLARKAIGIVQLALTVAALIILVTGHTLLDPAASVTAWQGSEAEQEFLNSIRGVLNLLSVGWLLLMIQVIWYLSDGVVIRRLVDASKAVADRQAEDAAKKNVCIAYMLWLALGPFGVHHLYLGNSRVACIQICMTLVGFPSLLIGLLSSISIPGLFTGGASVPTFTAGGYALTAITLAIGLSLALPRTLWHILDLFMLPALVTRHNETRAVNAGRLSDLL